MKRLALALVVMVAFAASAHAFAADSITKNVFPKEWQGEWCFAYADQHSEASAIVPVHHYRRGKCTIEEKLVIYRNRFSVVDMTCQLKTARLEETGAHASVLELNSKIECLTEDDTGRDEHLTVSVMTLGGKSRQTDTLSIELNGEIRKD
jgi:hypothetical protein